MSTVGLPLGVTLVLLLEKGYTGNKAYKDSDKSGSEESYPAPLYGAGDQVDTPPKYGLAEVVGVTGESPESLVNELFLAWGLVSYVAL